MHSAAGGTIQRLNPGAATVRSRSKNDSGRMWRLYSAVTAVQAHGRPSLHAHTTAFEARDGAVPDLVRRPEAARG
jgi:hypothetical protein